ncbi:hypothetical protein A5682_11220 [Mycobacterium mantenii]|uniref:hypothetical protein n=1 Tax=Mycobacterium mantenii TaxID=560555 RepID=UPI0008001FC2|nr:hypothetical protein [Mycobacterium mantenii]OBH51645.1 hypothetical protein A5687_10240 [Mycobacterium mantenii]OBH69272.1 hypothetical protein A5682_11220 [Mycobacterium mantenii]
MRFDTPFRMCAFMVVGCAGLMACGSQHAAPPETSGPTSTTSSVPASTSVPPSTPAAAPVSPGTTGLQPCVGLSICTPPPPDAEGNPPCYYSDGWRADGSGAGIEVWYFRDPNNPAQPDKVTALVRKKDRTNESQDANIAADQQVHLFEFPAIAQSAVDEVLFVSGAGRCFVIGP